MPPSKRGKSVQRSVGLPPLEYVHVVGYFDKEISKPGNLFRQVLGLLSARFGNVVAVPSNVSLVLKRQDVPKKNDALLWQPERDLPRYKYRTEKCTLEELCQLTDHFPEAGSHLWAYAVQQGYRAERSLMGSDVVWSLYLCPESNYAVEQSDTMVLLTLSTALFEPWGIDYPSKVSTHFAEDVMKAYIQAGGLYYCLSTSSYFRDDHAGMSYWAVNSSNLNFCIEQALWTQARQARRDKVRGIYASQYLSPVHVAKLGGKEAFIAGLLKELNMLQDLVTDLGDAGMILHVTPTPIDNTSKGLHAGSVVAPWVFRRFREAGLFL